jgi:hypothetical protein
LPRQALAAREESRVALAGRGRKLEILGAPAAVLGVLRAAEGPFARENDMPK